MTCGYVCPVCEGKGFLEDLTDCDYCNLSEEILEDYVSEDE